MADQYIKSYVVCPGPVTPPRCCDYRGHNLRLHTFRARYDLRKYYFTNRVVNIWNSLPSYVISADTVNCFKSRLDNFWKNQDIISDSDVIPIDRVNIIKDLGILIDEKLTFRDHIRDKVNKAYMMLGLIKRNFKYLTVSTFVLSYIRIW